MQLRKNAFMAKLFCLLVGLDSEQINSMNLMKRKCSSRVWWVECSVELDQREGKIIIFDTSKGLDGVSVSDWYGAI